MDEVQIIQYVAIILAIFVIYTEIKRVRRTTEIEEEVGFPRTLMHEDLPRGKAKIESVESQGGGKFTLNIDDGYSKDTITVNEVDIEPYSMYNLLVSDSIILITKELRRKLSDRELDRLKALPLVEEREKAQDKLKDVLAVSPKTPAPEDNEVGGGEATGFTEALDSLRRINGGNDVDGGEPQDKGVCKQCGGDLKPPQTRFCSRECYHEFQRKH